MANIQGGQQIGKDQGKGQSAADKLALFREECFLGQTMIHGLGNAEVDDLGTRRSVHESG